MTALPADRPSWLGVAPDPGNTPEALPEVLSGLSRENAIYRQTIAVCDRVGDAALRGATPQELAAELARMLGKGVVLLDASHLVIAHSDEFGAEPDEPWNPWDDVTARLLAMLERERRTLRLPAVPDSGLPRGCTATPITVGDTTLGYLLIIDPEGYSGADDTDLLVTTYAATLFALTLAHQRTHSDLGLRYRAAVLDALLSGSFLDDHDARRKAVELGLAPGQPYRIAVFGPRFPSENRRLVIPAQVTDELSRLLPVRAPDTVTIMRGSDVVTLLPVTSPAEATPAMDDRSPAAADDAQERAGVLLGALSRLLARRWANVEVTCGLSDLLDAPELAPRGLQQAAHAIEVGVRIGRGGAVVGYDDLGIYRLLLQIGDMRRLWDFAEDVLGELIAYEATHSLDLIGTLSTYLQENSSLKQTARRLRIHTNTVTYRIRRVEELTCLDLADAEDRLAAHIAVKIIESQRARTTTT